MLYYSKRGCGKTTHLALHSATCGATIVTLTHEQANFIYDMAERMNFIIPHPITYRQMLDEHEKYASDGRKYLIDGVDRILEHMGVLAVTNDNGNMWNLDEGWGKCNEST